MIPSSPVDLRPYTNATVATYDADRAAGKVNAWGNSFPAEELPFGGTLSLGDIAFQLPNKLSGTPDHIESLGQEIESRFTSPMSGLAMLAFGEMGDQNLSMRIEGLNEVHETFWMVARNWMVPRDTPFSTDSYYGSHLHYPGDYELDHLLPALWLSTHKWRRPFHPLRLVLSINPLFHILAISFIHEAP